MPRATTLVLFFVTALNVGSASALSHALSEEFTKELRGLKCEDVVDAGLHSERDALAMVAPWDPAVYARLKLALAARKSRHGSPPEQADRIIYSNAVVDAELSAVFTRYVRTLEAKVLVDAKAFGTAVCDVMRMEIAFRNSHAKESQKAPPSAHATSYVAIGQAILTALGCSIRRLDGKIDDATAVAWARLNRGRPLRERVATGPRWLLELYAERAGSSSCNAAAVTKERHTTSLAALAHLFVVHRAAGNPKIYTAALAGYAKQLNLSMPDSRQVAAFDRALEGLEGTLNNFQLQEDFGESSDIMEMFFKNGFHRTRLLKSPPEAKYILARALMRPGTSVEYAQAAVSLLRSAYDDVERSPPSHSFELYNGSPNNEGKLGSNIAALLSWAFSTGVGTTADDKESARWSGAMRREAFSFYLPDYPWERNSEGSAYEPSLSVDARKIHGLWLLVWAGLHNQKKITDSGPVHTPHRLGGLSSDLLDLPAVVDPRAFHRAAELADVYALNEDIRGSIVKASSAFGKFVIATILIEGHGSVGKHPELGVELLQAAAVEGLNVARVRLGHAYEMGLGTGADPTMARTFYEQAGNAGHVLAHLALARIYDDGVDVDRDLERADRHYRAAMAPLLDRSGSQKRESNSDQDWSDEPDSEPRGGSLIWRGLQQQLLKSSPYFSDPLGTKLLAELVAATPRTATQIGQLYLCPDCGGPVKPDAAARWLRLGASLGDLDSVYSLARLILRYPEFGQSNREAELLLAHVAANSHHRAFEAELLLSTISPNGLDTNSVQARVDHQCQKEHGCTELAYRLAIGAVSANLVRVGYDALLKEASETKNYRAWLALVDVYSLYGDFRSAGQVLDRGVPQKYRLRRSRRTVTEAPWSSVRKEDWEKYNARKRTFSRFVLAIAETGQSDLLSDFDALLTKLSDKGDPSARAYKDLLSEKRAQRPPSIDAAKARTAFQEKLRLGGFSYGLVNASRALSDALAVAGEKMDALVYELVALNAQTEMARVGSLESGPLPYKLILACQLARGSEHIEALGFREIATVLAKEAVNKLQEVRQALVGLPQNLRSCFTRLSSNQYRLLIGLFLKQGKIAEAEIVNRMLKDSEVYEYVALDRGYVHRAFDQLELNAQELEVLARAQAVKPILNIQTERYHLLRLKRKIAVLTDVESTELSALEPEIMNQDASFRKVTSELVAAIASIADPARRRNEEQRSLTKLEPLKGLLRRSSDGKAAALHFIVLPDEMHGILTTPTGQTSYTWRQIGGNAYSEDALNQLIDQFRVTIQRRRTGTDDSGRRLYNLLFEQSSFDRELSSAGIETLFLSLDRRLRYLPFAALRNESGYLVEKYALAMLSEATHPLPTAQLDLRDETVLAFGNTRGTGELEPLPHVKMELLSIVKSPHNLEQLGVMNGRMWLDHDFTLSAFQDSFLRALDTPSRTRTVVHVASHFHLDTTEDGSFLLLGNGDRLPLKDIRNNPTVYDFGDVDLLTLSACSTAYGPSGQGQDLESFAAIVLGKGAQAVLATQWPVADRATADFMGRFYRLQTEHTAARAKTLASVQREFIRSPSNSRSHPFFWAPFILIGNGH